MTSYSNCSNGSRFPESGPSGLGLRVMAVKEAKKSDRPALPADLMRRVRRIEIATNRLVDQGVAGDYHSVFKGRGVEFAEVRPYQPGDDIRIIDWNVTARMGATFVKQYVEERDLTIFLIVDVSGSLNFGSHAILKRELTAEISALLSFAALRNNDRVGAALVTDGLDLFLSPQRRRNHVLRLVREVLSWPAEGGTNLDTAVSAVLQTLKRRSVLFLISDFVETPFQAAIKAASARHDLIVIEIQDPIDNHPPAGPPVVLKDSETGRVAVVGGKSWRRHYIARREEQRQELEQLTRSLGVDHLALRTDRPYLSPLVSFFNRRKRRLQR